MIGEACIYLGKLFVPYSEKKTLHVKAYKYHEEEEVAFQEIFESYIHLREDNVIKKCKITTAGNNCSGLISLYVIVLFKNNKINIFSCSEDLDSLKMKEVEDLLTANVCCTSMGDIWLSDGPQLAVVNGDNLGLYSAYATRDYDMQEMLCLPVSCFKILNFSLVSQSTTHEGTVTLYVLVVSFSSVNPCKERIQILSYFQSSVKGAFNAGLQCIKTDLFFPVAFSSEVTAIDIRMKCPCLREVLKSESLENALLHLPWRENRTIVCTEKQCSVFYRNSFQYSCNIPYSDINYIFPLSTYSQECQSENIVLRSSSAGACYLKTDKKTKKMECAQEWKNAATAVVGCLRGNGINYLLIMNSLDPETWQSECSVSEISTRLLNVRNTDARGTSSSSAYLRNAVLGLQKRAMMGKAAVTELQYKISEKQAVMNEILRNLNGHNGATDSLVIGESSSSLFQASLVDILPLNDSVSLKIRNEMELKVAMRIAGHWKTVVSGNFIFGWTLENVSDRYIKNPKAYLMIENAYQKVIQKLFVHPSKEIPCQPTLSDVTSEQMVFKHGDMVSLVLCFAPPEFISETVNTSFVISWQECKTEDIDKFDFLPMLQEKVSQQITVKSTIAVTDVLGRYPQQGLSVVQQLMSFRLLQQQTILSISCMYSDLSEFEKILTSNDAQNAPVIINHLNMKFLIFNDVQSYLYGVNMSWKQLSRTSIEVTVHSKDVKEIILLTQWVYSVLPGDTYILPRNMNMKETSEIRNKLVVSMKNEVDLILQYLAPSDHVTSQTSKKQTDRNCSEESDTNVNNNNDRIILSREKFHEMREALLKSEFITDSIIKKIACDL